MQRKPLLFEKDLSVADLLTIVAAGSEELARRLRLAIRREYGDPLPPMIELVLIQNLPGGPAMISGGFLPPAEEPELRRRGLSELARGYDEAWLQWADGRREALHAPAQPVLNGTPAEQTGGDA